VEKTLGLISQSPSDRIIDEVDRARALEYALLAILLSRSPDTQLISRLSLLDGDGTPIGIAHAALAEAATRTSEEDAGREYRDLFIGLGRGVLLPYSSYYLTGTLYGRPLARLRQTLQRLGIRKATSRPEPEDHAAILCEIMASLVGGAFASAVGADREFFEQHLAPWIRRFFVDLENSNLACFYARVGSLGRAFVDVEREAFVHSA
jgi:TorA maturation chaperone TorD